MFPANNFWNTRVDTLPVDPMSDAWIDSIGPNEGFHMDFGSYSGYGIPINVVTASTPR